MAIEMRKGKTYQLVHIDHLSLCVTLQIRFAPVRIDGKHVHSGTLRTDCHPTPVMSPCHVINDSLRTPSVEMIHTDHRHLAATLPPNCRDRLTNPSYSTRPTAPNPTWTRHNPPDMRHLPIHRNNNQTRPIRRKLQPRHRLAGGPRSYPLDYGDGSRTREERQQVHNSHM